MKKILSIVPAFIVIAAMAFAPGCASKTDMETLQTERRQDRDRIRQLEAELEESRQQLKAEIEDSQSPVRQRAADMWAELQSMRTAFARLRGDLETMNMRLDRQVGESNSTMTLSTLAQQLDEIEFVLENQLMVDLSKIRQERAASLTATAQAPKPGQAPAAPLAAGSEHDGEPGETKEVTTDPAKALYDKAYALYKENQFERARSFWAEFTDTFKNHAYVPSAVFWQGQCYFQLKDYARAVILFEDVIEKFPKSAKFKSALLRAGLAWDYLGKPELAKMRMNEVVKRFPDSVEATQAKRFLEKAK
ncbi:tetratricopeptide repeat protein [Pseudodesulfovibrio sp. F-1]|uniref:Tetratricopeptide repeat protein n=1 Tax=Pseudodesulfovibrio alkaliphilus TaxID=2661613 RepID=A0A7K1KR92_9BACT|nr:tetratricopeptide repeat protein [Pseudodesulfovibrio alkaliphilus]MUM78432.1 tetratricopeptide repeat protein [Pseudodesulfovibrio alkaliphilus]